MLNYAKWCEIDINALINNMKNIRKCAGEDRIVTAVIKANGYGHGSVQIMKHLLEAGASRAAVSSTREGIELKAQYPDLPIMILGINDPDQVADAINGEIIQAVSSLEMAEKISRIASALEKTAVVHIKLDTGMNRIGFKISEKSADEIIKITKLPNVKVEGMFSHFATADETDKTFTHLQYSRYQKMQEMLRERGFVPEICHIANSAAIMEYPECHMDMVRSGVITYGCYPSNEVDRSRLELKPVMSLRAKVSFVKQIEEDGGVSYGLTDEVRPGQIIATVPLGYADGYLRIFSRQADVIIRGKRVPIRGRVCMDQLLVDVTDIPDVEPGDVVTLIGKDGDEEITLDELAAISNTINYELMCMIGRRVPRVYIRDGKVIETQDYLV